ncbi:MAG TPA: hypothetical protein VMV05_06990 [bacterium]|nr:hypothetical protein [bacterium]
MKKVISLFVLILMLAMPVRSFASYFADGNAAAFTLVALLFGLPVAKSMEEMSGGGSMSKATQLQKDFYALNNQPGNLDLLKQAAGGDLSTAEIIK